MDSILRQKSYYFAVRIVKLHKYLKNEHKEYVLSKQLLRSGTAIGALIREAQYAQSRKDFINTLSIALKEANETECWLILLSETDYLTEEMSKSIMQEIKELLRMLTSSLNTSKKVL
jgi:four helix bundle protein